MNVVFDGENLLIKVNQEVTTLDIQTDIYSDWKVWMQTADNSKFLPALRTTGGDPTIQDKAVAPYFFLMNGWKIKPASWNHTLNLVGNLFVDNPETHGSNVVIPPDGSYTVLVNMSTTSDASKLLVGSGVTQQDKEDIAELVEQSEVLAKENTVTDIQTQAESIETRAIGIEAHCTELETQATNLQSGQDVMQESQTQMIADILKILKIQEGRWKIENNQLIIYDEDGQTIHKKFNLLGKDGKLTEKDVFERVPTT